MINKLIQSGIALFFFLFPVFFLQNTADFYDYNKMALLVAATFILFFLFCAKIVKSRHLALVSSSFGSTLFLLALAVSASTLLQSPNLVVALTTPLSVTAIVTGFLFYFILVNNLSEKVKNQLFIIIIFSAVLVCLYSILLFANVLPKDSYTPAGNFFTTALFLGVILVYLLTKLVITAASYKSQPTTHNQIDPSTLIFSALSLLIVTATLILLVFHLFTDQRPVLLGMNFGWIIFAEAAKNVRTLFLGVGPANFITAFTLGKPVFFNNSPYWNIIFTSSSTFLLNLATEAGIVAAGLFIIIFVKSVKILIKSIQDQPFDPPAGGLQGKQSAISPSTPLRVNNQQFNNLAIEQSTILPYQVSLVFALFLQIIFPGSMVLFILTLVLLAFSSQTKHSLTIDLSSLHQPPYYLLIIPLLISVCVFYFGGRWYLAETYFKQSLDAAINNQAAPAYNLQLQAINTNPSIDRYYLAFSRLNLALANGLSAKEKPTDQDKQDIPRLVQQSIDYGRNAVVLNRTNVTNWDNLAQNYSALINFATDSESWAVSAYQQKIQLDPVNPQNHLGFGRLYLSLKKYPEAENQFRQSIILKPDLAASYYNLAIVLREQKKYQEAYTSLQNTSALIAAGSKDAETVDKDIRELFKLDPQLAASVSAQTIPSTNQPENLEQSEATPPSFRNLTSPKPTISIAPPPITP